MKVNPERIDIQQPEVSRGRPVSESTFSRMAATVNFINERQHMIYPFNFNGLYSLLTGFEGVDGAMPLLFNLRVIGLTIYNRKAGTSGNTTIDILRQTESGGAGSSIFTVKPSLAVASGDNAYLIYDSQSDSVVKGPASGATAPEFNNINFDAGDVLRVKLDSAMSGAEDCGIILHYIPR